MRFAEDGVPLVGGSSREFFAETQAQHSGEWSEAQPQDQLPDVSQGCRGEATAPAVWLQIEVPLSMKTAARSRAQQGLINQTPSPEPRRAGVCGSWLLFIPCEYRGPGAQSVALTEVQTRSCGWHSFLQRKSNSVTSVLVRPEEEGRVRGAASVCLPCRR